MTTPLRPSWLRLAAWTQMLRYGFVGLLNTAVGYGTIALLTLWGARPTAANLVGYGVGIACSLVLNTRFTFRSRARLTQVILPFLGLCAVAWVLNWLALQALLRADLPVLLAQAGGMVVYTVSFYLLLRLGLFRSKP